MRLGALVSVRPVVNDFFTVCGECSQGDVSSRVEDVLLFLKVVALFDEVNALVDSGVVLSGVTSFNVKNYSLGQLSSFALFEKRVLLLKELLASDVLKIKLRFMETLLVKFNECLNEGYLVFKQQNYVTSFLMNYVRDVYVKDRCEDVNFKVSFKGVFPPSVLFPLTESGPDSYYYYYSGSSLVETFFRVCLMFSYSKVDDTFFVSAPNGVKVALQYLAKDYMKKHPSGGYSLMVENVTCENVTDKHFTETSSSVNNVVGGTVNSEGSSVGGLFGSVRTFFKNV